MLPVRYLAPAMAAFRAGDWLVVLCAAAFVAWLFASTWHSGTGERVVIKRGGETLIEAPLAARHTFRVAGALGVSVVEVAAGRARVARDPSPRQLCVRQGWITRAGEAAICLPNQVSVEIMGRTRAYDSLIY